MNVEQLPNNNVQPNNRHASFIRSLFEFLVSSVIISLLSTLLLFYVRISNDNQSLRDEVSNLKYVINSFRDTMQFQTTTSLTLSTSLNQLKDQLTTKINGIDSPNCTTISPQINLGSGDRTIVILNNTFTYFNLNYGVRLSENGNCKTSILIDNTYYLHDTLNYGFYASPTEFYSMTKILEPFTSGNKLEIKMFCTNLNGDHQNYFIPLNTESHFIKLCNWVRSA